MIFKVLLLVNNLFGVLMNRDVYQFYTNISADQALPLGPSNFLHNAIASFGQFCC